MDELTTTLFYLAEKKFNVAFKELVNSEIFKGDLNAKGKDQDTLLHIAARYGNVEIVTFLLQKGVIIDSQNIYQQTPFLCATFCNYPIVMKLLLDNGADVNACDKHGYNALYHCVAWGYLDNVKLLLEKNVDSTRKLSGQNIFAQPFVNKNAEVIRLVEQYYNKQMGILEKSEVDEMKKEIEKLKQENEVLKSKLQSVSSILEKA